MVEYTNKSTPCPKCAGVVFTILNASMPTVNKCVKCSETWNPNNQPKK